MFNRRSVIHPMSQSPSLSAGFFRMVSVFVAPTFTDRVAAKSGRVLVAEAATTNTLTTEAKI